VLLLLGNLPEAERAFNSALQAAPAHPYALQRLMAIRYVSGGQISMPVYPASSGDSSRSSGMKGIQGAIKVAGDAIDLFSKFQKLFEGASTSGDAAMGGGTVQDFNPWIGIVSSADPGLGGGWWGPDNSGY
jgi:hypothetical protein